MKWITDFKIAVIEENVKNIEKLIDSMPQFEDKASAKEALALVHEATNIVNKYKLKTLKSMNKIRQAKAFLNSH